MDKNQQTTRYHALSEILKAIAHPTRLLILESLAEQKRCVSDLTNMAEVDTSTVSKHLALMKNAGIITSEKSGNQVFYSLRVPCVLQFLGCIESVIALNAKEKMDLLNVIKK